MRSGQSIEVAIASAGNRVKTSGASIKHVELETLKDVSSGYGRYVKPWRSRPPGSKSALIVTLLIVILHVLFISPVIRNYRGRLPIPTPWRKGLDLLTEVLAE